MTMHAVTCLEFGISSPTLPTSTGLYLTSLSMPFNTSSYRFSVDAQLDRECSRTPLRLELKVHGLLALA